MNARPDASLFRGYTATPCPACGYETDGGAAIKGRGDRAGLEVRYCTCGSCKTQWKQIVPRW